MTDTDTQTPPTIIDVNDISADLESMDGDTYTALVRFPGGKQKRYTLGLLGFVEYNEIVLTVPLPEKPRKYSREAGGFVDQPTTDYRAKEDAVLNRRRLLLLAASIDKVSPLKGATLAEKADFLGKRPSNIIVALMTVFTRAHHGLEARLEQLSGTFQLVSGAGGPDTGEVQPD
jgi:hypothetical protein